MVRIRVTGDDIVTAMLVSAGKRAHDQAQQAATETARRIEQEWERNAPIGPTGVTSSDPANVVEDASSRGVAGAEVYNRHFVARFLQTGTVNHAPKYDFLGAADQYAEGFPEMVAEAVEP